MIDHNIRTDVKVCLSCGHEVNDDDDQDQDKAASRLPPHNTIKGVFDKREVDNDGNEIGISQRYDF